MSLSLCLLLLCVPAEGPGKPDIDGLLTELKSGDPVKQDEAARKLAAAGADAVPGLTEALKEKKEGVAGRAARALGQIGAPAKSAVPALIERIDKGKGKTRDDAEAIEALLKIDPRSRDSKAAVPALRAIVRQPPSNPCRVHAVVALGKMGRLAKDAVPDLAKVLGEDPVKAGMVRFHAATALGKIGEDAKAAVPDLVKLLKDKKAGPGRRTVAVALGQMGPAAKEAVDALKSAREEAALREAADAALAKIQGKR
jgi:HEAT repeat protein